MYATIHWPAMLKYSGDDELLFVLDESQWLSDADLSFYQYDDADYLIDSDGQKFRLPVNENKAVIPERSGDQINVEQAIELLRNHFSVSGACCIAKIQADSISECLSMLQLDNG